MLDHSSELAPSKSVDIVPPPPALRPRWNAKLHELRLGDHLLLRFRRRATFPELILAVFEEEAWVPGILDPLPMERGKFKQSRESRLHKVIQRLNRAQKGAVRIYFYRDGTGKGIIWSLTPLD